MTDETDRKEIVVTCAMADGSVERVEAELRKLGFDIDEVLTFTGNITGKWEKSLNTLREIPEVVDVSESGTMYPQ